MIGRRSTAFLALTLSITAIVSLIYWILAHETLATYSSENTEIKITEEGFIIKDIYLNAKIRSARVKVPLFRALDPTSDYDRRDYEVKSLKIDVNNTVSILFRDGTEILYPLFLGTYSKNNFRTEINKYFLENQSTHTIPATAPR